MFQFLIGIINLKLLSTKVDKVEGFQFLIGIINPGCKQIHSSSYPVSIPHRYYKSPVANACNTSISLFQFLIGIINPWQVLR